MKMSKATFDRIAKIYNIIEKYIFKEYETLREIIEQNIVLKDNSKILDIGGGTGLNTDLIVKYGHDVTLIDFSRNMLLEADKLKFKLILGDGTCLPIKNNIYDSILMINTLHHIDKNLQQKSIDESFRILKSDGVMYVIEVFPPEFNGDKSLKTPLFRFMNFLLFKKLILIILKIDTFVHNQTFYNEPTTIKSMFKKSGFKNIKIILPKNSNSKYIIFGNKTGMNR